MADYTRTYGAPAAQLRGEFFMDTERDGRASIDAGRDIFRNVERIRIVIPGAVASIVVKNVDDELRMRYADQYRAFKAGQEAPLSGTPLEEWPILNRAMIAELKHLQIRTVEELANLSDLAVQHIGMGGTVLRERARAWLDEAQHEAFSAKLVAENDVLRSRVATLEQQVEALGQHVLQLSQSNRVMRDMPPATLTQIPADYDPVELAKRGGQPGVAVRSALDQLADMSWRPRRPPAADAAPALAGSEAVALEAGGAAGELAV